MNLTLCVVTCHQASWLIAKYVLDLEIVGTFHHVTNQDMHDPTLYSCLILANFSSL